MKLELARGNFPLNNISIDIGGSKSESNRLLILQSQLANIGIKNLSQSDDTKVLQEALKVSRGIIDIGHAGTAMRFLTAYFSAQPNIDVILMGSQRMHNRPIGVLVDALRKLGANISYLKTEGYPPLKIIGNTLVKDIVSINSGVSSQYISALLLIAPSLPNGLKLSLDGKITSLPYIEMTLSLLKQTGISSSFNGRQITISPVKNKVSATLQIESDWSSASYFYSLVALSNNCKITLFSFNKTSVQGDAALVQIYEALGVETTFNTVKKTITISKKKGELADTLMLDLSNTPDLAQTIAVTCFGLGITCRLWGLQTLKIKETDRLFALKNELEKMGASVKIDDESIYVERLGAIKGNMQIETYQDHRMAMAFAPLAIIVNLSIANPEVVSKSYPKFWQDLSKTGINCVEK
ncbi:MAG: 3-phosphoshikimate 1-carboxyvinyltransferase [Aequorivita sp.]|nr:3-phosphoshikimate 1-carboxyvinyltransferase [Aequorivita sp.]|tara:strand:+ start:18421 stop:19653 length:1233 start_codon:yes stop_codon:yes gene_type:complete